MKGCLRKKHLLLVFIASALLLSAIGALAQTSSGYDLAWWAVDAGGITLTTGGGYTLGGTAGQSDAGSLAGSGYSLDGGFWSGGMVVAYRVHLPLLMR